MWTVLVAGSGSGTVRPGSMHPSGHGGPGPGPQLVRMRPGPSRGPGAGAGMAGPAHRTTVGGPESIEQEAGRHFPTWAQLAATGRGSLDPGVPGCMWPQTPCRLMVKPAVPPRSQEHMPCGAAQCLLQGQHPGPEQGARATEEEPQGPLGSQKKVAPGAEGTVTSVSVRRGSSGGPGGGSSWTKAPW